MRRWLLLLALLVTAGLALWAFRADDIEDGAPLDQPTEQRDEASARRHAVDPGAVLRGTGAPSAEAESPAAAEGLTVAGTLLDPDGLPKGYAVVVLERGLDGGDRWENVARRPSAPSGRFAFEGLAPGRYLLSALSPPGLLSPVEEVDLTTSRNDVVLRYRRSIEVTIEVLAETGEPLPGIHVAAEPQPTGRGSYATTDEEGRATLRDLDPLATFRLSVVPLDGTHVGETLESWTPANQRFLLHPAILIRGRVVDEKGNPVPRAHVAWTEGGESNHARTNREGSFVIRRPDATPLRIRPIHDNGWAPGGVGALAVPGGEEVELVLPSLSPLEVQVVDWPADVNGQLRFTASTHRDARWVPIDASGHSVAWRIPGETYAVFGLGPRPGTYVYRSEILDHEAEVRLDVREGEAVRIAIEDVPAGHAVESCAVTDGAGVSLSLHVEGDTWSSPALPPGRYTVRALAWRVEAGIGRVGLRPTHRAEGEAWPGETVRLVLEPIEAER